VFYDIVTCYFCETNYGMLIFLKELATKRVLLLRQDEDDGLMNASGNATHKVGNCASAFALAKCRKRNPAKDPQYVFNETGRGIALNRSRAQASTRIGITSFVL
jgi:hypothetical protein